MPEKKRKRHDERHDGRPNKKVAVESPAQIIHVSVVEGGEQWAPILGNWIFDSLLQWSTDRLLLASTPGLILPSKLALKPYTKPQSSTSRPIVPGPELLLHSSAHPKLDYTAREETSNGSENHLKHYIGIYDPSTGQLQIVQARKLVVRSTLRAIGVLKNNIEDEKDPPATLSARSNLGLAFGTKKSQKAIRNLTANAIQASHSKPKTQDSLSQRPTLDPLASAVVSSMPSTSSMPTPEEMQAEVDENKPRPQAHLEAEIPADVYPIEELVGGVNVLRIIGVKEWMDKVKVGEDVQVKSMFVARRLKAEVQGGNVKRIKTLKYLLLLVEWFKLLKPVNRGGLRVPKLEDMGALVSAFSSDLIAGLSRRFSEGSQLNKWHIDNLITHILALAIAFDNCTSDTHDIQNDMRLEVKDISRYYAELGCLIAAPTETERTRLSIGKAEAGNHRIARLRLPLVFQKMRVPVGRKKR